MPPDPHQTFRIILARDTALALCGAFMRRTRLDRAAAFAGRESEMDILSRRLSEAVAGRGGIVLLAGEPGIGKTRLAEELATVARSRGACVLWGRCYEGEGAPAFWPWIEVLRVALRDSATGTPEARPDSVVTELVHLLPEIGTAAYRLDAEPAAGLKAGTPPADSAHARFRLFDTITAFLGARAAEQPQVVILDDLQWADTSSLLMLQFLARTVRETSLLVLGAYRDTEVDRGHPLSGMLTALSRERGFERLPLRGVSSDVVATLTADVCGSDVATPAFTEALHDLTVGNPLFVQETLRHLAEVGRLTPDAGPSEGTALLATIEVPDGVRWVLRQRLARLPDDAAQVLSVAAVIGREFEVAILASALEADGLPVMEALDQAEAARLVTIVPGADASLRYRFEHDLIRDTLIGDLGRAVRVRLHHRVGEALEDRWRIDLEGHLSELANHFVQAAPSGGVTKALTYARRAGDHAVRRFAYDEAARWYALALDVTGFITPSDETARCDLLLAQGEALLSAGRPLQVVDAIAPAALALAEMLGDAGRERAARACRLALAGVIRYSGPGILVGGETYRSWADRATRYAPPDSVDRVYADISLGSAVSAGGDLARTLSLYQDALALARRLDDPTTLFYAALNLVNWSGGPRYQEERLQLAEEFSARPATGVHPRTLGRILWRCGSVLLDWGDRGQTEALWRRTAALATQSHEPELHLNGPIGDAILATLDGRLEDALTAITRLIGLAAEVGSPVFGWRFALRLQERPLLLLGPDATVPAIPPPDIKLLSDGDVWAPSNAAGAALRRAQSGDLDDGRRALRDGLRRFQSDDAIDASFYWHIVTLLELAILLGDRAAAGFLAPRLALLAPCAIADWGLTTVARHLGAAAALLGDRARARAYYEQALAVAGAIRFRPELALTDLQIAELLAGESRDQHDAQQYLERAIEEFRSMKMQPALARALVLADHLQTRSGRTPQPAFPDGLTAREVEVLGLVATGATNREIAAALVVTPGTVHQHLINIFAKIGARRRADAAAYATRHGLTS
jgi:DNA-binding CsgD family transcriptional regulator